MPETGVIVRPGMDFCVGLKVSRPVMEISTPSAERARVAKRQLWAPGSGTAPAATGWPTAAAASSAVMSEQASSAVAGPFVGTAVTPVAA